MTWGGILSGLDGQLRKGWQASRGRWQALATWPAHGYLSQATSYLEQVQDLAVPLVMLAGQNSLLVERCCMLAGGLHHRNDGYEGGACSG